MDAKQQPRRGARYLAQLERVAWSTLRRMIMVSCCDKASYLTKAHFQELLHCRSKAWHSLTCTDCVQCWSLKHDTDVHAWIVDFDNGLCWNASFNTLKTQMTKMRQSLCSCLPAAATRFSKAKWRDLSLLLEVRTVVKQASFNRSGWLVSQILTDVSLVNASTWHICRSQCNLQ